MHQSSTNDSSVLLAVERDHMTQFDRSGRLALNRTSPIDYHLIIYEVQQSDDGRYTCAANDTAVSQKQHVTVVRVKGTITLLVTN